MTASGATTNQYWHIWRINKDGFREETTFVGSLKNKPKGWKVDGKAS